MTATTLGQPLPWTLDEVAERRYANTLLAILIPLLLLSVLMPLLPQFQVPKQEPDKVPERLAQLVIERQKPPPPPPPEPVEQKKPPEKPEPKAEPQPEPTPQQTREASRVKAEHSGVLAFADDLQELRNNKAAQSVRSQRKLSEGATTAQHNTRKLITSQFGEGTTGIKSQPGSPGQLGGTTQLAGHSTTQVEGPPGGGAVSGGSGRSGSGGQAARTTEEIQIVFDRNKSSLFALYQRALRKNPTLQGTVVLRLVIQPSGKVSSVKVVSSELNDAELESKIVNRVKLFDFGAKNVPVWRGKYPIRFFPS